MLSLALSPLASSGRSALTKLRPWRRFALLPLIVLALVLAGCEADSGTDDGDLSAEGIVVDVRGTISEVEEFDLLLSDGERLTLAPEGGALERSGFSPAHLREHMALAERIAVRYREEDGRNVMTGVDDASE